MIAPLAWVLVRAKLNCTSGASVEAVRPVSAAPVRANRAADPEVRAAGVAAKVPARAKFPAESNVVVAVPPK